MGKSEIGSFANQALFIALQHAPRNSLREQYFPLLKESVEKGESSRFDLATMKDRILMENGQPQIYSSQTDAMGRHYPIEDIKRLNKRRRQVGTKISEIEIEK